MNEIETQILKNQSTILLALTEVIKDLDILNSISDRTRETANLFLGDLKGSDTEQRIKDSLDSEGSEKEAKKNG